METEDSVRDEKRKLTAEEIGRLQVKTNEIIRRIVRGNISYEDALEVMQKIIIEGKSAMHLDVILGKASIIDNRNVIDCESNPFVPDGWKIDEHFACGFVEFTPKNVSLYMPKKQEKGNIGGNHLWTELWNKPFMNANVLDHLLAHPEIIPEEWKGKCIFFWGTFYKDEHGIICVRYLKFLGNSKWSWGKRGLGCDFSSDSPAAIFI